MRAKLFGLLVGVALAPLPAGATAVFMSSGYVQITEFDAAYTGGGDASGDLSFELETPFGTDTYEYVYENGNGVASASADNPTSPYIRVEASASADSGLPVGHTYAQGAAYSSYVLTNNSATEIIELSFQIDMAISSDSQANPDVAGAIYSALASGNALFYLDTTPFAFGPSGPPTTPVDPDGTILILQNTSSTDGSPSGLVEDDLLNQDVTFSLAPGETVYMRLDTYADGQADSTGDIAAVPAPAAAALLATGMGALGWAGRRRRRCGTAAKG